MDRSTAISPRTRCTNACKAPKRRRTHHSKRPSTATGQPKTPPSVVATTQPRERAYELRNAQVRGLLLRTLDPRPSPGHCPQSHRGVHPDRAAQHRQSRDAQDDPRGVPKRPLRPMGSQRTERRGQIHQRLERVFQRALEMPMPDLRSAWVERWWMERLQTKARPDGEGLITKATAWRDLASFRAVIAETVKQDLP